MKFHLGAVYYCTVPNKIKKIEIVAEYTDADYKFYDILVLDPACPDYGDVRDGMPESLLISDGYFAASKANKIWRALNAND